MPPAHPFDYVGSGADDDKLKEECGIFGVTGVADVIEQRWGSGGHAFVDYQNATIAW